MWGGGSVWVMAQFEHGQVSRTMVLIEPEYYTAESLRPIDPRPVAALTSVSESDKLGELMGAQNVLFAILVVALLNNYLAPKKPKPPRLKARYRCDGFEI